MRRPKLRGLTARLLAFLLAAQATQPAWAAGPAVLVEGAAGVEPALVQSVRDVVASRRAVREPAPMPPAGTLSAEQAAMTERATSIRLALERARKLESEAAWEACVREAAGALSDAIELLSRMDDLALLRELHAQIGACTSLAQSPQDARLNFLAAALLDEAPIRLGLHREEAERAQEAARQEILARPRGKLRVETTPPGAQVWIDGRLAPGTTPLELDIRLGDHFVTTRRFRFEPHTERSLLQPSGVVRIALDPARRSTLREQLASLQARGPVAPEELRLARASWAGAEQLVLVSSLLGAGRSVDVLEAASGQLVRSAPLKLSDATALRTSVCAALGETCEPPPRGVPWYVWPLAAAALAGAAVTTGVLMNASRTYRFCPAAGCD